MKAVLVSSLLVMATLVQAAQLEIKDVQYPTSLATKEGTDTRLDIMEDSQRGVTCYRWGPQAFKVEYVEKNGSMRTLFDGNNAGSFSCVKTHKGKDPKYNEKP